MTYDPTSTTIETDSSKPRSVAAFFDTHDAADKARADLVAAGISPDSIAVAGGAAAEPDVSIADGGGFWHALKEFFMPDEDRYTYAEGLRRGGVVLTVQTGEAHYDRVLDILDADGAVDIDERAQTWRSDGWAGFPVAAPMASDLAFSRADSSTAGFGASVAGEDGYSSHEPLTPDVEDAVTRMSDEVTPIAKADLAADASRVGTGLGEAGLLNPDMRERIGSGTASMTPPTPTGPQDATLGANAAVADRSLMTDDTVASAEDATLGSPTRSGSEAPGWTSTIGSPANQPDKGGWDAKRDDSVQRSRVRGYIVDPEKGGSTTGGNI